MMLQKLLKASWETEGQLAEEGAKQRPRELESSGQGERQKQSDKETERKK